MNNTFLENPITTEIIRNSLTSAAEEMNDSLARSSYSPIIYEMKDCSVGIFNEKAELLGQSSGLPMFLGNLNVCIEITRDYIGGIENFKDGDIYIMNDSYMQGAHLNDMTVISPIFLNNELIGFSATRAHWLDIGAKDAGYPMDAHEIYQEGIRIKPTKIYDAGTPCDDVINLIVGNSRMPDSSLGDLNAQISACRTGEKSLINIANKFGLNTLRRSIKDIFKQSELLDKEQINKIPDGVYEEEGTLDNDGVNLTPVKVKVKVTIKGDSITIDLTGSSEQREGMTNCGLAQTISASRVAFKHMIGPDSPVTGGNFKTMDVIVPEKTIFSAQEPAACGWYFTHLGLLIDLIIKALSPVLKNESAAAHYGDSMVINLSGTNEKNNEFYLSVEPTAGGWGAFNNGDGQSGLINNVNGDFKNMPIEIFEDKYPVKINSYKLRNNSGGHGKNRGGLGIEREYEILSNKSNLSLWFERSETPAWGLFGGGSGEKPEVLVTKDASQESMLKVNALSLSKGNKVLVKTGGGGGFGAPHERERSKVLNDVLNQYIDKNVARDVYGVILKNNDKEIDHDATDKQRHK